MSEISPEERISQLETAVTDLEARIDNFEKVPKTITDSEKINHQHAGDWLRMVNTTIWTLNSIFLIGSLLVFNNLQSPTVSLYWKHTAGHIVLILCVMWFVADLLYTISAFRARFILRTLEAKLDGNNRLYSWPNVEGLNRHLWWQVPIWILWIFFVIASYAPVAGISYLAVTEFIQAR
jgi:hypothetical protein